MGLGSLHIVTVILGRYLEMADYFVVTPGEEITYSLFRSLMTEHIHGLEMGDILKLQATQW